MSSIGGPSGVGGPKPPSGPGALDGPDQAEQLAGAEDAGTTARAKATGRPADIDAVAAEIAAGKLTPQEAIDRLVEATASSEMDAAERAELRELLADLVANDPYLSGLANRL